MSILDTLASAVGIDRELARQRDAWRKTLAGEPAAIAEQKRAGAELEATRRKVASGATWPGQLDALQNIYDAACARVKAVKLAAEQLKSTAQTELRLRAIDDKRKLCAATGALGALERELSDAERTAVRVEGEYNQVMESKPSTYPGDDLSNKMSVRDHERAVRSAKFSVNEAKHAVEKLQADIAAKRDEIAALKMSVTDNERQLLES